MSLRPSARTLITLMATAACASIVALLSAVVQQSLADTYASAIPDAVAAIWTIGIFLTVLAAAVVWTATGYLLSPIHDLRRDVALAARARAVAENRPGELEELQSLRLTIAAAIQELESRASGAESEQRRVLGLFEATSEGIVQVGANGRFLHVNAAARKLLGLPAHAEGQPASSLIRNVELREIFLRAISGEDTTPAEVVVDHRQLLIAPQVLRASGENIGAVITVVDLTELRRLETVRRDFVANVSHELKTPLTSIRGYVETLMADDMPRDAQLQFLEVVARNANRLQRIVEDLLDLSRLQSGGWQPQLQDVDAAAIAQEVWESCAPVAAKRQIHFQVAGETPHVRADEGGLRQVFTNLLENALRYTPDNGVITVTIARPGRLIEIIVRDNGSGIPRDALPRIFERFYRVDPARSRAEGGTGLGLSIVKHLVESMGGEVSAESELGKGTAIKVLLPEA